MRRGDALRAATLAVTVGWLCGCSVLLDPDNCTDDGECNGGICQDGICIGGGETPDTDPPDVQLDGIVPAEDLGPDVEVDADVDAAEPDMGPEPDMRAEPEGPLCMLAATPRDGTVTAADEVTLTLTVTDPDTDAADLVVQLDGEAVDFDGSSVELVRPLAEGPNTFELTAVDPDALNCSARVSIEADRTAPTIDGLTPPAGADLLTGDDEFPVTGTVIDAHFTPGGDATIEVAVDGDPVVVDVDWDGLDFVFEVELAEGANAVEVAAIDDLGNRSEPLAFAVRLDTTPPDIEIDAPTDGDAVFTDRVVVVGRVLDEDVGVDRADLTARVEAAGQRPVEVNFFADGDGRFEREVPLFEGENTLIVVGRDDAGNEAETELTVTRLEAEPCVTVTLPPDGAFTGDPVVQVGGDVCPAVDRVEVRVGPGAPVEVVPVDEAFATEVRLPRPGPHTITATAFAGDRSAVDEIQITLDETAPDIELSEPDDGACTNVDEIRVCGQVSDAESGIASLVLVAADAESEVNLPVGGGPFCGRVAVPEGDDVEVVARVTNRAGGVGESTVGLRVDRAAPDVCIVRDGDCLGAAQRTWFGTNGAGQVRLAGRAEWGACAVASLTVDGLPTNVDAQGRFSVLRAYDDGAQEIELRATDIAGNDAVTPFVFRVDSTAPTLDAVAPGAEVFTVDAEVRIDIDLADAGSGLVSITLDGEAVFTEDDGIDQGRRSRSISRVVALEDGVNLIELVATDLVGNTLRETITVYRDVDGPEVVVTSPEPDAPAPVPLVVTGTIDDGPDGAGPGTVTVNGVEADVDVEAGTWRATNVPVDPEDPTLTVDATDVLGNALDPRIEVPITVSLFGSTPAAVDGLDFVGLAGWVGFVDANSDGLLDVVALAGDAEEASRLFVQQLDGTFSGRSPAEVGLPENLEVRTASVADLDADGAVDLFIVAEGRVAIALGNGVGGFGLVPNARIPGLAGPRGLILGDITRNLFADAIILAQGGARLFLAAGDGTFDAEPAGNLGLAGLDGHRRGAAVDLNRDGVLDIVAVGQGGASLWFGDRFNAFTPAAPESGFDDTPADVLQLIDGDRDGRLDVFTAGDGAARFMLSDGAGGFTADDRGIEVWPNGLRGAARVDYDGDTRDDLIGWGPAGLRVWRNTPAGFQQIDPAAVGLDRDLAVATAAVGDLDGDGDDDLLLAGPDGLRFVRSNLRALDPAYAALSAYVYRALGLGGAPADGLGARIDVDLVGGDDGAPERALLARATGPTVITTGAADLIGLAVHYVDLGGLGQSVRTLIDQAADGIIDVFAREGAD